ncbi:MAG: DUF5063 domain-containing protein [Bacteroidales bacterium]|nr:DUF5063 domain-containing protein [Bacteroidales bacterium]
MNSLVYHKNTIEFITVAKEFVKFCEIPTKQTAFEVATILHRLLPLLYLKATLLPDFENKEEDIIEAVDEYQYNRIKEQYEELFGELDLDCVFPETMVQNQGQSFAPISEILADIYQDTKNTLINYQSGSEHIMESSLFLCKQNFELYWGQRLVLALQALHQLLYLQKEAFENISPKKIQRMEDTDSSNWIITKVQNQQKQ